MKKYFTYDFKHSLRSQLWRLISGPLVIFLIPLYLSAESQGYWYTFGSVAALAVFADLGFSTILMQFSAHEFAFLNFNKEGDFEGEEVHLTRISTLFRFALNWSVVVTLIAIPVIWTCGYYLMSTSASEGEWVLPWTIFVIGSGGLFVNSVMFSFIEGCNQVGSIQKIKFNVSVASSLTVITILVQGGGLFAIATGSIVAVIVGQLFIFRSYGTVLAGLLKRSEPEVHEWKKDIFPLLWRYAISWSSGYFMFQIFTPLAFLYYGAMKAGQVGMSIAVCTAIYSIANVWVSIVVPKINMLVAKKDFRLLNETFNKHLLFSCLTYILGVVVLFPGLYLIDDWVPLLERLVDPLSFLIIVLAWLGQIFVNAYAVYMRAFKKDPLVLVSVTSAVYICVVTFLVALYLPFIYYFIGFMTCYIWMLPWVYMIYKKFQRCEVDVGG